MTRVFGLFTAGLGVILLATPGAKAGGYYFGVQFGHQPRAQTHHRSYSGASAPSAGYAPMMMMAPAAGCSGGGFAPMMAPSGGCSGSGLSYGYSYAAPSYGYYAPQSGFMNPQSGLLSTAGGLLEALEVARQIRTKLDDFTGGGQLNAASKKELQDLRSDLTTLTTRVNNLKIPEGVGDISAKLTDIQTKLGSVQSDVVLIKISVTKLKEDHDALKKGLKDAGVFPKQ